MDLPFKIDWENDEIDVSQFLENQKNITSLKLELSIYDLIKFFGDDKKMLTNFLFKFDSINMNRIEFIPNDLDWTIISSMYVFNKEQILRFEDKLCMNILHVDTYKNLPLELIRKYKSQIDWDRISYIQRDFKFLSEFKERLNWKVVSINWDLSEEEIEIFSDKVDWYFIAISKKLSPDFIERFKYKLDPFQLFIMKSNIDKNEMAELAEYAQKTLSQFKKTKVIKDIENKSFEEMKDIEQKNLEIFTKVVQDFYSKKKCD